MARGRRGQTARGRGGVATPSRPPTAPPAVRRAPPPAGGRRVSLRPAVELVQAHPWAAWRLPLVAAAGSGLVALAVYLRTLAPSIPTGDSGELITVAAVLGIAHPPGYPLFTMLGHLFTLLPFGSVAYRVNLMSAVLHAVAVGITVVTIYRLIGPDPQDRDAWSRGIPWGALAAAVVGGLALAFSNAFWAYAVVAEVFALNSCFAALIICLLLEWQRRPERVRLLWAFGLTSGLAASNHHTIVLIAPACLVLLISGARKLLDGQEGTWMAPAALARHFAIGAALIVVGLLPYLYLPIAASADPPLNWGDPRTLDTFLRHIARADYGTFRLTVTDDGAVGSPLQHVGLLLASVLHGFTPLGAIMIAAGGWWLWAQRRVPGLAIGLAFFFTGVVFVAYANPFIDNPILYGVLERFYILPSVFVPLVLGPGAYQVILWLTARVQLGEPGRTAQIAGAALLLVPLGAMVVHYPHLDHSWNRLDQHFGEDMLAPLEPGSLFITQGDVVTMAVDYLQLVEGLRRDVIALDIEKLKLATYVRQKRRQYGDQVTIPWAFYTPGGQQMAQLVEANWQRRPVYLLGNPKDPDFADRYDIQRAGFANRLLPKGSTKDRYEEVTAKLDLFRKYRFPDRLYPETTFESSIVQSYGRAAFDIGYVLDDGVRDAEAIPYYQMSIRFDPKTAPAYKNLGLLLRNRGDPPEVVGPLWEEYIRLDPEGDQVPAIKELLRRMGR